jgi:outer membrane lipoprotein SlyB
VKKLLRRLVLLGAIAGAIAGAIYAVRTYLREETSATQSIQMVFDDGSTRSLASNTAEGREFAYIARKIVEIGL